MEFRVISFATFFGIVIRFSHLSKRDMDKHSILLRALFTPSTYVPHSKVITMFPFSSSWRLGTAVIGGKSVFAVFGGVGTVLSQPPLRKSASHVIRVLRVLPPFSGSICRFHPFSNLSGCPDGNFPTFQDQDQASRLSSARFVLP